MDERQKYRYLYRQKIKTDYSVPVTKAEPPMKLLAINHILRTERVQDPEKVFREDLREIAKYYDISKRQLLQVAGDKDVINSINQIFEND